MTTGTINKDKLWLGIRFVALPTVLLTPFWLVKYTTARCYSAIVPYSDIPGDHRTTTAGILQTASNPKYFGVLLWVIIVGFLIASFLQVGTKKYRLRYLRAKQQLMVAAASAVLSGIAYAILYQSSQWKYPPNWSCNAHYMLHGSLSDKAHVGLGLAPIVAIVVIALYLIAPLTALVITRPGSRKLWTTK